MSRGPSLLVIAKAPVAGRCKTRLCPPCSPEQAAALAEAALRDTLAAVVATPAARRVLVLDGAWAAPGLDIVAQRGTGLAQRLASAFADAGGPALLIGMDTPQVTPALLSAGLDALRAGAPSVLGAAHDGGYWAIGLQRADAAVFDAITMSRADTGEAQRRRLVELGLAPVALPLLRDVDLIEDAYAVAAAARESRFARALAALDLDRAVAA